MRALHARWGFVAAFTAAPGHAPSAFGRDLREVADRGVRAGVLRARVPAAPARVRVSGGFNDDLLNASGDQGSHIPSPALFRGEQPGAASGGRLSCERQLDLGTWGVDVLMGLGPGGCQSGKSKLS